MTRSGRTIDREAWRGQAWRNRLETAALLAGMAFYAAVLGWLLWGPDGVVMLLMVGVVAVAINPSVSPAVMMRMYRARPIGPRTLPDLSAAVAELARRAGLEAVPELYYIPSRTMNAFAVGRSSASAIGITDGILRALSGRELLGVIAHEVSHIRNDDIFVMGLADLLTRATHVLCLLGQILLLLSLPYALSVNTLPFSWWVIPLLIAAPTLSALMQLALSRTREFDADLNASELTGDPEGLASALQRMDHLQGNWFERILLPGRHDPGPSLLRTHPDADQRVRRLLALRNKRAPEIPLVHATRGRAPWAPARAPRRRHLTGLWY